jgi:hypothetical protein
LGARLTDPGTRRIVLATASERAEKGAVMRRAWIPALSTFLFISGLANAGQDVPFTSLPQAVRVTVERETKGGTITEIELENKKGQASYYEVEFLLSGVKHELHVSLDGHLLLRRLD